MRRTTLLATALSCSLSAAGPVLAEPGVPLPVARPHALVTAAIPAPSPEITGSIPAIAPQPVNRSPLRFGLDALSMKNGAKAIAIRNSMPQGLDRHMLTWSIAMSGLPDVPYAEITRDEQELTGWPGMDAVHNNGERALYRENPPSSVVLQIFRTAKPQTPQGVIVYARALLESGNRSAAARLIAGIWRSDALDKELEDTILNNFGGLLSQTDHRYRMDDLMYRGRATQARRVAALAGAQSLYEAWDAVNRRAPNAARLIAKVDGRLRDDPAFLFLRIEYLRHQDKYDEAAALLARAPRHAAQLINSSQWWDERRIVARGLADNGEFRQAYAVVAATSVSDPVDAVDAQFHAGWYALRGMNQPKLAIDHFSRILTLSNRPLSASRGHYWLGRAYEAEGREADARKQYELAANYPCTFYGELASARLHRSRLDIPYPRPSAEDRRRFAEREAVEAIDRFETVGYGWRADILYRALGRQMDSPGELALLTAKAERAGNHQLSLQIGKAAYGRGIDVPALAFPVGVIPDTANISGSGKALAYAIARQESAFNPNAISAANARGLLQLMPATAKAVARRHGLPFIPAKLTTDPGYNATLGAHYLGEQIDSFGGSYILTFIAYNAGPNRVQEWLNRYGDPRGKPIDVVVDWIERIPFPETRNYVQRVMENYQIYKARLGQPTDIEHDLRFGRTG